MPFILELNDNNQDAKTELCQLQYLASTSEGCSVTQGIRQVDIKSPSFALNPNRREDDETFGASFSFSILMFRL